MRDPLALRHGRDHEQPSHWGSAAVPGAPERAPTYDRENRFFQEDFDELRDIGYLSIAVPEELGGAGASLAEVCQLQRRLAYYAGPSALAVNMHLYWTGVAADLWRAGDTSLQWLLEEAVDGEVFAAGHAETGNDIPVLLSTTRAEPADGGYRFTGRKAFGSLGPAWTQLGIHGLDTSDPEHPRVVHAFAPRDSAGLSTVETWDDVLGMRATRSDDTVLDGVFVPEERIARVVDAGFPGIDAFVLGIFVWALLPFGNIYFAIAHRMFDLTVERLEKKTSIAMSRDMRHHPGVQHDVAAMALELEAVEPHLDRIAADWSRGVDHGAVWPVKIFAAKSHAVEASWRVVDRALDVAGGFGIFPGSGLERLFRDARLGRIHPANRYVTHEVLGKALLGVDLADERRWG
ncbi:MAG: acyl-CoA dehydrogenase [Gemmatimonadales bacterium]|nr:MAG: acyl-CoA dehydrogenase [Gemmatimonadales bacterium]